MASQEGRVSIVVLVFLVRRSTEMSFQQAPEQVCSIETRKPEHAFIQFEMKDF